MDKIYIVEEHYDVDGGFGDAIPQTKVVFITQGLAVALRFVAKYHNPQVYDKPYAELKEHYFTVREESVLTEMPTENQVDKMFGYKMTPNKIPARFIKSLYDKKLWVPEFDDDEEE